MTEKLKGAIEYYEVLQALDVTTISRGKITAAMYYAGQGSFVSKDNTSVREESFWKGG